MPCFSRETVSLNLILLKSAVRKCVEEFFLATKCNVEDPDPKVRVILPDPDPHFVGSFLIKNEVGQARIRINMFRIRHTGNMSYCG